MNRRSAVNRDPRFIVENFGVSHSAYFLFGSTGTNASFSSSPLFQSVNPPGILPSDWSELTGLTLSFTRLYAVSTLAAFAS